MVAPPYATAGGANLCFWRGDCLESQADVTGSGSLLGGQPPARGGRSCLSFPICLLALAEFFSGALLLALLSLLCLVLLTPLLFFLSPLSPTPRAATAAAPAPTPTPFVALRSPACASWADRVREKAQQEPTDSVTHPSRSSTLALSLCIAWRHRTTRGSPVHFSCLSAKGHSWLTRQRFCFV